MNKFKFLSLMTIAATLLLVGCSKDPVHPEEEHNHDDQSKVVFTFYKGHYHGTSFHKGDSTVVALRQDGKFINPTTNALIGDGSQSPVVQLSDGELQKLSIVFLAADGDTLNGEFIKEANVHQFFFIPSVKDVLEYTYKDARLGFDGDFKILQINKELNLEVVLRHGLNKSSERAWNDVNFRNYGGSDDFKTTLRIKTVEGEAHAHD